MVNNVIYTLLLDRDIEKIFTHRIEQTGNFNSYSELFIYENEVYKIYMDNQELSSQNIETLKYIFKYEKELSSIKEIVLPTSFLVYNNNMVGFKMPYIKGILLLDLLQDNNIGTETKKMYFLEILKAINKTKDLSFPFSFSDLHEKNIIIDTNGNIKIIDCDGFIINNNTFKCENELVYGKYLNNVVTTKDINSIDYICLLCMIFNYLLKNIKDYNCNPIDYLENYNIDNQTLNNLIKKTKKSNFVLTANDIEELFKLDLSRLKPKASILTRIKSKITIKRFKNAIAKQNVLQ